MFTPSKKITLFTTTSSSSFSTEPTCVSQAMKDPQWRQAMSYEFDALIQNGTWELVLSHANQNMVG